MHYSALHIILFCTRHDLCLGSSQKIFFRKIQTIIFNSLTLYRQHFTLMGQFISGSGLWAVAGTSENMMQPKLPLCRWKCGPWHWLWPWVLDQRSHFRTANHLLHLLPECQQRYTKSSHLDLQSCMFLCNAKLSLFLMHLWPGKPKETMW